MPLYIDAWQSSVTVQDMTDAEHRAFLNLLMAAWQSQDGGLPTDDAQLAKLSRKRAEWPTLRDVVMAEFHLDGDRYFNRRLRQEWERARESDQKRRKGAQVTNEKRRAAKRLANDSSAIRQRFANDP